MLPSLEKAYDLGFRIEDKRYLPSSWLSKHAGYHVILRVNDGIAYRALVKMNFDANDAQRTERSVSTR